MLKNQSIIWMWTFYYQAGQYLKGTTSTGTTTTPREHLEWEHTHRKQLINVINPVVFCIFLRLTRLRVFICIFKFPQTNNINENVTVTATGTGEATVTVSNLYCWDVIIIYWCLLVKSTVAQVVERVGLCSEGRRFDPGQLLHASLGKTLHPPCLVWMCMTEWMNGTWNPVRCFGWLEKCHTNPIHH